MSIEHLSSSPTFRMVRIVVGAALAIAGFALLDGTAKYIVCAVGVLVVIISAANICLLAPLFGKPLRGRRDQ
ncbi:hypothetical protein CR970_03390 [Candidatus Saccharibacteria bacterium]|nr:MAG: hypothetical protein CR970_03390 [Candidatus Saccharibacteria bacterium]